MQEPASMSQPCPATREAVWEWMRDHDDTGCPLCWLGPEAHTSEALPLETLEIDPEA